MPDIIVRRTFHVHPDGDASYSGRTWAEAVPTLAAAQTLAESGRGDRILVAPTEVGGSAYAGALTITKDFLTIEAAVPGGYARPDISGLTGLTIEAQGVVLKGLRIVGTNTYGLKISGNGYHVEDCVLEAATDALLLQGKADDDNYSASEGKILNNLLRDSANGIRFKQASPPSGIGPTHVLVDGNRFMNITSEDIIDELVSGGNDKTFYDCTIGLNRHQDRNKAVYIDLNAGTANRGLVEGIFAVDAAGTLDNTRIALATAIVCGRIFKASGLVDASAF